MKQNGTKTIKNHLLKICLFIFGLFLFNSSQSQVDDGLETLDESIFIGGVSPVVLSKGDLELNFYTSLFSSWLAIHESVLESSVKDRLRLSDFNLNIEGYYGLSPSAKWDIGLRLRYGSRRVDNNARSSPFKVLSPSSDEENNRVIDKTYTGLREIGLRFRAAPFEFDKNFTINAGVSFGRIKGPNDDEVFTLSDRHSFDINLSYFINLTNSSMYYFLLNHITYLPGTSLLNKESLHNSTASFLLVQRFGNLAIYPGISYAINYKAPSEGSFSDGPFVKSGEQLLGLIGLQLKTSDISSFNISGTIPFIVSTTNLQQRLVRESYSFFSIGGRLLL